MRTRKSWREKMDPPNLPKVVTLSPKMRKRYNASTMLVPSPREVEAMIQAVPKRSVITVSQIRKSLAEIHDAETTCPLTTGILVRIVAEAAEEEAREGKKGITPYWRVLKDDGSLNPKFPGGVAKQAARLSAEGHPILPAAGKRPPRVALS